MCGATGRTITDTMSERPATRAARASLEREAELRKDRIDIRLARLTLTPILELEGRQVGEVPADSAQRSISTADAPKHDVRRTHRDLFIAVIRLPAVARPRQPVGSLEIITNAVGRDVGSHVTVAHSHVRAEDLGLLPGPEGMGGRDQLAIVSRWQ